MKVSMLVECDSVCELQNTILQMADFCSLTVDEGPAATVTTVKTSSANYTLEQVRDIMSNLPTIQVRELMQGFGVKKLTDLDAANYPELVAKAGVGA